ncbi:Solute carrier family 25 member 25 [Balamuthia mandrillaris]
MRLIWYCFAWALHFFSSSFLLLTFLCPYNNNKYKDNNGVIDAAELTECLEKLGLPAAESEAEKIIKLGDVGGDHAICFDEFSAFVRSKEKQLFNVFKEIDLNHDGELEPQEIRSGLLKLGIQPELIKDEDIEKLMHKMNTTRPEAPTIRYVEFRNFLLLFPAANNKKGEKISQKSVFTYWLKSTSGIPKFDLGEDMTIPDDSLVKTFNTTPLKILTAGAIAGTVSRTATAPFDRLKTLLQAQSSPSKVAGPGQVAEYTGVMQGLRKIYAEGGWLAFFRGNGTNVIKIAPESACKFYSYDIFKKMLCKGDTPSVLEKLLAGSMAGVVSQTMIYPLEITKTRLALAKPGEYSGIADTITKIAKHEGVRALYRGLAPSLIGIIPYAGVDLAVYSTLKEWVQKRNASKETGILTSLGCGAVSSTCGQVVAYPLQLIRTRMQAQGMKGRPVVYSGMADCFLKTVQSDGMLGLYKGIAPNFLKALPAISISYVVYEQARKALGMDDSM